MKIFSIFKSFSFKTLFHCFRSSLQKLVFNELTCLASVIMPNLFVHYICGWTNIHEETTSIQIRYLHFLLQHISSYSLLPSHMGCKNKVVSKVTKLPWIQLLRKCFQFISYQVLTSGWTTTYTLGCQPVDYSENPEAKQVQLHSLTFYAECQDSLPFTYNSKNLNYRSLHLTFMITDAWHGLVDYYIEAHRVLWNSKKKHTYFTGTQIVMCMT